MAVVMLLNVSGVGDAYRIESRRDLVEAADAEAQRALSVAPGFSTPKDKREFLRDYAAALLKWLWRPGDRFTASDGTVYELTGVA